MKKFFFLLIKIIVAASLIAWLVYTDKLEFASLRIYLERPDVLSYQIATYVVCCLILGVARWNLLMRALDLDVSYWRSLQLQMIGFFFNTAVPGAVGGDIVKAVYVMREQKQQRKAPALLTVLLDRIVGVASLFVIASVATLLNLDFISSRPVIWPLAFFAVGGCLAVIVATIAVFYPFADGKDPFIKILQRNWFGFAAIRSAYEAMRVYRTRPWTLVICLLLSILIQGINTLYTLYISKTLTGVSPDLLTFALIYPLAILTTALPLAPGGMGVGHVAFDSLYRLVGWSGGANVFNVVVLASLAMNLLGVIPYILFRAQTPKEEAAALDALLAQATIEQP